MNKIKMETEAIGYKEIEIIKKIKIKIFNNIKMRA
jgi:hypothetical protein